MEQAIDKIGYNLVLFNKRKEKGWSLRKAANKLQISFLLLLLIEKGYFLVPKKYYLSFIRTYELNEDFFETNLLYPEPLKSHHKKMKEYKIVKLLDKIWTRIALLVILVGSITIIPFGVNRIETSADRMLSFFPNDFVTFRQGVMEHGKTSSESSLFKDYECVYDYDSDLDVRVACSMSILEYDVRSSTVQIDDARKVTKDNYYSMNLNYTYSGFHINITASNVCNVRILMDAENKIKPEYVYDISAKKELTDQSFDYYLYIALALNAYERYLPYANKLFASLVPNYTLKAFGSDLIKGDHNYKAFYTGGTTMLLTGSLVGALSLLILLPWFYSYFKKKHTLKMMNFVSSEDDFTIKKKQHLPLKQNIHFPFFIPETAVRGFVILFLAFLAVTTSMFLTSIVSLFTGGTEALINFDVNKVLTLRKLISTISVFSASASILHMFVKTDILIYNHSYLKNALMMFVIGVFFYIFEVVLSYSAQSGVDNLAMVMNDLANSLPGNIFWGLGIYSLIAFFLFSKPTFIDKKLGYKVLWRCLIVLPLGYLIFSIVYSVCTKVGALDKLPYAVSYLLFKKNLFISTFVIAFLIGLFLIRRKAHQKYDEKDLTIYFEGNRYLLAKNILAASIIFVIGIIDLIFHLTMSKNTIVTGALGLGKNYYALLTIPVLLFYRSHIGERSPTIDNAYIGLYGLSLSIPYILVAVQILPIASYILPMLKEVLL